MQVVALFQHPTVRGLARSLEGGGGKATPVEDVLARAERQRSGRRDSVAIIGMAGRFPGAANLDQLWDNLCRGVESIRFFSDDELDPRVDASAPGYVKARGVLADADKFDAPFFGEAPASAELIDPQQRVLLEVAWAALEDAGVVPERHGASIGVFAGTGHNTYLLKNLVQRPDRIAIMGELALTIGNDRDFVATRIAHKLNLKGPAVSVQTACSTSLVATFQAVRSLLDYECDVALAGGASVTVPQNAGHQYAEGAMLSADGHTRSFDASATGTVFSDGAGVVVLKRLADAQRDGDRVYAVIRGAAINNDGADKASFTAPSVAGQAAAIAMAHAVANVDPATITYVEAHGTATPLGDPVEVEALTQAFRARTPALGFCALGSIKSNFGHQTAASGVAGLIKTALSLHHAKLVPSLFFDRPNPNIDFAATPFFVQTRLEDWTPPSGVPRRAGVSSFGVGGTNAHVVLEEAPAPVAPGARRPVELLLVSAKSEAALDRASAQLAAHLGAGTHDLADVAYTLQARRAHFAHRRVVASGSLLEAAGILSKARRRNPGYPPDPRAPRRARGLHLPGAGDAVHRDGQGDLRHRARLQAGGRSLRRDPAARARARPARGAVSAGGGYAGSRGVSPADRLHPASALHGGVRARVALAELGRAARGLRGAQRRRVRRGLPGRRVLPRGRGEARGPARAPHASAPGRLDAQRARPCPGDRGARHRVAGARSVERSVALRRRRAHRRGRALQGPARWRRHPRRSSSSRRTPSTRP